MVRNDERRALLADAGLQVLADAGSRGLTHRAVDDEAGVPRGTTANYFGSRDALLDGLLERLRVRLWPAQELLDRRATQPRDVATFADHVRDLVRRFLDAPELGLALFEFRLEAARRPEVAARLRTWQAATYARDVDFVAETELPGTPEDIALLRFAVDGLLLDRLTVPFADDVDPDHVVATLVERVLAATRPKPDGDA